MNVKAQGLLNAGKFIEETYGRDVLRDVLHACGPAVRETYTSATNINWHPFEELCEFCEAAERRVGIAKLVEDVGAAGARANIRGMVLRVAFYFGKPEHLMTRAAALWRQFNDEGAMTVLEMSDRLVRLEVTGVKAPRVTFCRILTGWVHAITVELGVSKPITRHVSCRGVGDARCIWEVRGRYDPLKPQAQ